MSEFKYACPVCGQHMKCDSSQSGTVMECPTCFQKIIVPQAPAIGRPEIYHHWHEGRAERPIPAVVANAGNGFSRPRRRSVLPCRPFSWPSVVCAAAAGPVCVPREASSSLPAGQGKSDPTPGTKAPGRPVMPPKPAVVAPPASDATWTLNLEAAAIPAFAGSGAHPRAGLHHPNTPVSEWHADIARGHARASGLWHHDQFRRRAGRGAGRPIRQYRHQRRKGGACHLALERRQPVHAGR